VFLLAGDRREIHRADRTLAWLVGAHGRVHRAGVVADVAAGARSGRRSRCTRACRRRSDRPRAQVRCAGRAGRAGRARPAPFCGSLRFPAEHGQARRADAQRVARVRCRRWRLHVNRDRPATTHAEIERDDVAAVAVVAGLGAAVHRLHRAHRRHVVFEANLGAGDRRASCVAHEDVRTVAVLARRIGLDRGVDREPTGGDLRCRRGRATDRRAGEPRDHGVPEHDRDEDDPAEHGRRHDPGPAPFARGRGGSGARAGRLRLRLRRCRGRPGALVRVGHRTPPGMRPSSRSSIAVRRSRSARARSSPSSTSRSACSAIMTVEKAV
jgi:hypothetical protein